jgi:hypothetical protein
MTKTFSYILRALTLGFFSPVLGWTQASESSSIKFMGGGFTGFKANLNSNDEDTYGFDNYYMYLGARAQLPQNWNLTIRLDSDTIGTVYGSPNNGDAAFTTSSLFFIRAFFIENPSLFVDGARFRIGRHSTLYTESIESDISLRWLGDSLNRTSSFLYKSVNGFSYLLDRKAFKLGLQIHNGAETLNYKPDTDASLSTQLFSSFKISDDLLKFHLGLSLDTKSASTATPPIDSSPLNGRSAWMMGLTHKSSTLDASLELGQLNIPTNVNNALVYAFLTQVKLFQTSYGLFLKYFGANESAYNNNLAKSQLTFGPTYQFNSSVKTALLYDKQVSGQGDKTQFLNLKFTADF